VNFSPRRVFFQQPTDDRGLGAKLAGFRGMAVQSLRAGSPSDNPFLDGEAGRKENGNVGEAGADPQPHRGLGLKVTKARGLVHKRLTAADDERLRELSLRAWMRGRSEARLRHGRNVSSPQGEGRNRVERR